MGKNQKPKISKPQKNIIKEEKKERVPAVYSMFNLKDGEWEEFDSIKCLGRKKAVKELMAKHTNANMRTQGGTWKIRKTN